MSLSRKAINFDLSTNELKKHFKDTREPYIKIKTFMLENGFEHRQYLGYASKEPMDDIQIDILAKKLVKEFSWLSSCIQEFDVTDIGEQYSLNHIFKDFISINKDLEVKSPTKEHSQKEQAKKQLMEQVKQSLHKDKDSKSLSQNKDLER
ncbi:VapD family protein [Campylobacter cuniculorum]|uniref:Putative virulence-associated protein VapD n=1 Tax=Campylobacter cuniculorum DSM 23162 = LMG 24588 TaxID=1121267 RepID=A0A1W6BXB7_9BACT|nr:VapD family protein [Campylobacter cuniculorum]ARJ56707.1 putative virulence-associated protein VapD [Campylobacter cuniculorum DSM 23162 = LMG 24588]